MSGHSSHSKVISIHIPLFPLQYFFLMAQLKPVTTSPSSLLIIVAFSATLLMSAIEARKLLPNHDGEIITENPGRQWHGTRGMTVIAAATHRAGSEPRHEEATDPGHSPGVGHLTASAEAQIAEDSRLASPGHSLTAGHSINNDP